MGTGRLGNGFTGMEAEEAHDRGGTLNASRPDLAGDLRKAGFLEEALPRLDAVYRFALRLSAGDSDEAQDLAQETFLRAYRSWEAYTPGTNVQAWLFTICRNLFLRERERRGRRETPASRLELDVGEVAESVALSETPPDPAQRFFDSFIDEEVLAAVDGLPDDFREAVVLSDLEGLSYGEVAEVLNVPLGTVKSRLYRGRRLLQKQLFEYAREMGYVNTEEAGE